MKILFIVQGEGRGHLTQAITLEQMLRRHGHEVVEVLVGESKSRHLPGFFNRSASFTGIQIAGLANRTEGGFRGIQVAAIANFGENLRQMTGLQIALHNTAEMVEGMQLGLVNFATGVVGGQIGLYNRAEIVRGFQIGFANACSVLQARFPFFFNTGPPSRR